MQNHINPEKVSIIYSATENQLQPSPQMQMITKSGKSENSSGYLLETNTNFGACAHFLDLSQVCDCDNSRTRRRGSFKLNISDEYL